MRNISLGNKSMTPQRSAVPGRSDMIQNNAGGYGFETTLEEKVWRFIVMGSESTYYGTSGSRTIATVASLEELTKKNAKCVVDMAVHASLDNISPTNDYALFVMAYVMSNGDISGRRYAAERLNLVARTGTHLFNFVIYAQELRGWGKVMKRAISNWYTSKDPGKLAYQICKYKERGGTIGNKKVSYSHRDLLRLSHVMDGNQERKDIYDYITHKSGADAFLGYSSGSSIIYAVEAIKSASSESEVIGLIRDYKLTHEMVPNEWKDSPKVWAALLETMPITATIRNLAKMTTVGLLKPGAWDSIKIVRDRLTNMEALIKARVHPISILKGFRTYASGHGYKGSGSWAPVPDILEILESCLDLSFGTIKSTGKKYILGVDVSGSMSWAQSTYMAPLMPSEIAMTMAFATYKREPNSIIIPFSSEVKKFDMSRFTSLDDMLNKTKKMTFGSTDVSLPIAYAIKEDIDVDIFSFYTDAETWVGNGHPYQWLEKYTEVKNINAGYIAVGINASHGFTLADPRNPRMVDIVGFDPGAPRLISNIAEGKLNYRPEDMRMSGGAIQEEEE